MTTSAPGPAAARTLDPGVRLIVAYKAAKAVAELALVAGLVLLARGGERSALHEAAALARAHLASRWSELGAGALAAMASGRGLRLLELGLLLDGVLTALEGWGLWRGKRWGPWLVVGATLLPLPWEAWEIARTGSPVRVAVAAVNVAVAAYLAVRIARARR